MNSKHLLVSAKPLGIVWFLVLLNLCHGQYIPKSQGLTNSQSAITFVKESAEFWKASQDAEHGGFFTDVDRMGNATGTRKTILTQSRHAFGFAKAFMLTGDETYLDLARDALDFQYAHFWDATNDGWIVETTADGTPTSSGFNQHKWSFFQDYALLGPSTLILAADQTVDRTWLTMGTNANLKRWDSRSGFEGYYEDAAPDYTGLSGKGFLPTVDALNTYLVRRFQISGSTSDRDRALLLGDQIVAHLIPAMDDPSVEFGFPEEYDSDWKINTSHTVVNPGHILKAAWMLAELHLISPKESYLMGIQKLIDEVLDYSLTGHEAWDATHGGPYANYNWMTGQRGNANKEWWMLEQAFNAAILAYYLTEEEKYLQMADESLAFFEDHFVDDTYGEVYIATSASGIPTTDRKGDFWKAGFHSTELGWFTYLYGQLFYHFRPVTLYYHFDAQTSAQSHHLNPLAISDSRLSIQSVRYQGLAYTDFDPAARQLNLQANVGGVFAVTFGLDRIPGQDQDTDGLPDSFEQAYFASATSTVPTNDTDGDGANEHSEWLFGTSPIDGKASPSESLSFTNTVGSIQITIQTITGRRYWLEASKDLQNYVRISNRREGTGSAMTFTDNPGERSFRSYQVRVATP